MEKMDSQSQKRQKVSVVIGSGGIRALAALPLLEYLQSKNVQIDLLVGSGGGATLAALFAAGFPSNEIPQLMSKIFKGKLHEKIDFPSLFKILGLRSKPFTSPPAPYQSAPLHSCLQEIFKEKRIEELSIPLRIHTTTIPNCQSCSHSAGVVADCLYATNAQYPFLQPLLINGMWHGAGVSSAAIPLYTAVEENMDIIFVMGVRGDFDIKAEGLIEYVSNFFSRSCAVIQEDQITMAINMHQGEIVLFNVVFEKPVNLWDDNAADEILTAGRKTFEKRMEEIEDIIGLLT